MMGPTSLQLDRQHVSNHEQKQASYSWFERSKKYESNSSNWTNYKNLIQQYEVIEEAMIETEVADRLPEPMWMNANGDHVEEGDSFRYKVILDITKLKKCVTTDEVI